MRTTKGEITHEPNAERKKRLQKRKKPLPGKIILKILHAA